MKKFVKVIIILGAIVIGLLIIGLLVDDSGYSIDNSEPTQSDAVTPLSSEECKGQDSEAVVAAFTNAGFENVRTELLKENNIGENANHTVESISIGTEHSFDKNSIFRKTDKVIIRYYPNKERYWYISDSTARGIIQSMTVKYPEIQINESMVKNTKNAGGDLTIIDFGDKCIMFSYGDGDNVKSYKVVSKTDKTPEALDSVFDLANKLYITVAEANKICDANAISDCLNDIRVNVENSDTRSYSGREGIKDASIMYEANRGEYDGENHFPAPFKLHMIYSHW